MSEHTGITFMCSYYKKKTTYYSNHLSRHLLTRLYQNSNHAARQGYHYVRVQSIIILVLKNQHATSMHMPCPVQMLYIPKSLPYLAVI